MKLESFIFDVFEKAASVGVLEVVRQHEFSPVKNAPGSATDSPDTALAMASAQSRGWLVAAGAVLEEESGGESGGAAAALIEVSPLVSVQGEGLRCLEGLRMKTPLLIRALSEGPEGVLGEGEDVAHEVIGGVNVYTVR
jgi:UDP-N-acetylglucosamine/UDP-N-acetylgalactosamine diphosphorylase